MELVSPARFPDVAASAAHYESYYLKACHPDGGVGVWIRYTVHKKPGAQAKGSLWFTLFDAASGVVASKAYFADPGARAGEYIHMGEARFTPGELVGRASSPQLDAAWELRFEGEEPPLWHLPQSWMYSAPFPRTKVLSPHPAVHVSGRVVVGDRTLSLEAWPGMVGHNWGTEHAKRAMWIHGLAARQNAWLDLTFARVAVGPLTTPWLANGALSLSGRRHRLGGLRFARATRVDEDVERCRFTVAGDGVTVHGVTGAPRDSFVSWIYAQPSGGEHQTINCSIADLTLDLSPGGRVEVAGGAAYELQMEERYPAIPVQPFPDG